MKKFIIPFILFSLLFTINNVFADSLYDLYSNNSEKIQSTVEKIKSKYHKEEPQIIQSSDSQVSNYRPRRRNNMSSDSMVQEGSKNYGQYAGVNKRTNPVRIGNPYNSLNDKYMIDSAQAYNFAPKYDGNAVRFKKGSNGKLSGYNKYGQKVGDYKVNRNGTITQYNKFGKTTTYK